ncbi:ATP-dependent helicase HrpB [Qipengyuania atrilutea]|uniref:RNA helicase n=1 Tax=Qipengyuania atrilutea TaxID=2744473 RepID=A0A850H349_9SPHN|nr:ATP-dependent helicase HrpB [Actirhodobacter atriluteus]NVD44328.1 ATP-dependent helicase HrpB [Actirhodobacter atriluteus]
MRELPINAVLPQLLAALSKDTGAVLIAPPGAGKTTAVASALLDENWCSGQIILTSPRRVAARAAAERMAQLLSERAGETVGYVTRLDSKQSAATRILVMTEGIFVNRIAADPELTGVSAVLFDEAHERHLDTDLGLALALESRSVLREDLRVVVMSATIDGERFAKLIGPDTAVIESEGKAFPMSIEWLGARSERRIEEEVGDAVIRAWKERDGDILTFLPGVREIERTRDYLAGKLADAVILPLHGQVAPAEQRAAIRRDPDGRRRIVLATAIAETSLTLEGVSVVVDSGLSRRAEYDRAAGTTRLVTHRASQASAAQRAGRAARQGPGIAYRLWEEAGHAGRRAFDPPEIETSDLTPLMLLLAQWGTRDPGDLGWVNPPPAASVAAAQANLKALGALDDLLRLTKRGEELSRLPLAPASAAMLLFAGEHGMADEAARLALLLQERGLGGRGEDLERRLANWNGDRSERAQKSRKLASGWAAKVATAAEPSPTGKPPLGIVLASGRPDFVARRRDASGENWLAAGGRGFRLDPASSLAREEWLVIGDAQGHPQGARITAALALTMQEVESWLGDRIEKTKRLRWTGERVEARLERRLGAIILASGPDPEPDEKAITALLVEKAAENLSDILPKNLLARARFAGVQALSEQALLASADTWLLPLLHGRRDLDLPSSACAEAALGLLSWDERQRLDEKAPRQFVSLAATQHAVDYTSDDAPSVEVRVQALFGLDRHPMIGDTLLLLKLTSPAGRPVQATRDLPGFWRGSWADVAKEMKGRYPKHRWPEQPWTEKPSLKTKNAFNK